MTKLPKVRLYLFTNSYSGKTIAAYLKDKYSENKLSGVIRRLAFTLGINYHQLQKFIISDITPNCPYRRVPGKIRIYLEIENELGRLKEEKLDDYLTAKEDYHNQLLYPAIERAAGNSLTNIANDREFQEKLQEKVRKYTRIYYQVAYRYKLPTIRIVPFILRLIS